MSDPNEAQRAGGLDDGATPPKQEPEPESAARTRTDMQRSPDAPPLAAAAFPAPSAPLARLRVIPGLEDELPGLVALGPVPNERKVREWELVLQSMSVWNVRRRVPGGWVILVNDADYPRASRSIDEYEAENRDWPPRPARERTRHPSSPVVPVLFALLVAFFLVTGPVAGGSTWFQRGVAVSEQVLHGQPWRAVTALTLHADSVHVLGNAISGTVFVSAVQRRLGSGAAALAVLASGIAGNVANAFYHHLTHTAHASLGASTAVFGAIGILAATQLALVGPARDAAARAGVAAPRRSWLELAGPIVGGFALLGALGAGGERDHGATTDLGAHLFGLLAGMIIGFAVALPLRRSTLALDVATGRHGPQISLGSGAPRWWVQTTLGALAAAVVLGAWQVAMRR